MKKSDIKILLVDDEVSLVEAMKKILTLQGFQVDTAESGTKALEICHLAPYNIIFLDVNMPDLNGLETYRRMREIIPDVPVIMITGYGRSLRPLIEEAASLGVKGCLDKPFKIQQVIEAINTWAPHEA